VSSELLSKKLLENPMLDLVFFGESIIVSVFVPLGGKDISSDVGSKIFDIVRRDVFFYS